MGGQIWEVVGGKKDGLLVRTGKALKSPESNGRLLSGCLVEELELEGERLRYKRLTGEGPETGWVSLKLKGNDLLVRTDRQPGSPGHAVATVAKLPQALDGLPELAVGEWRVLIPASSSSSSGLHVCCCAICETGHMLPTMRIARAVTARSSVRKVSIICNVYGARKMHAWLSKDPDVSGKIELLEFQDGWNQARMDEANDHAQEEDGSYHGACNDGIYEQSQACFLQRLAFGEDRACCFVVDIASDGYQRALGKINAPQLVIKSSPLSSLAYPIVVLGGAGSAEPEDGEPDMTQMSVADMRKRVEEMKKKSTAYSEGYETPDLVHCFELPPLLASVLPALPSHAVPVGILTDEVKLGQLPKDIADFVERPGPPVIYVSMGSVATFNKEQMAKVVEALSAPGEWRVLWSLRAAQQEMLPPGGVGALGSDFLVSAWLPQAELLQHPKIAVFLSHCGWGACCEAIVGAKPVVAFPMFADQYCNAWLLDTLGISKTVGEEPLGMDMEAGRDRFTRVLGVRTGAVQHTRLRFTADGLKKDIRMVLKGKAYQARAKAMCEYSSRMGGASKAAEEIEKWALKAQTYLETLAVGAPLTSGTEPSLPWPQAPLARLQAVAERRGDMLWAAAKEDVSVQIVVTDADSDGAFYLHSHGDTVEVKEGMAQDPAVTFKASREVFDKMWEGIMPSFDAYVAEGNPMYMRRLLPIMLFQHQDPGEDEKRTPRDGVIRPPPGGQAPGPVPQASLKACESWLAPDGTPDKRNKLLLLSLPWAGHIVHLKRIAAWFAEHKKYEVHLGYMSAEAPQAPQGVSLHGAEASELTDVFDIMQDKLKAMAMAEWGSKEAGGLFDGEEDHEAEAHKILRFMIRLIVKVKPTVVVADSAYSIAGLLPAACQTFRCGLVYVNSPGIKEGWIENNKKNEASPEEQQRDLQQRSAMPDIDIQQVMSGKFDPSVLPPGIQNVLSVPGFDIMKLLQLFMAMGNPDKNKPPLNVYPSSCWMVEEQPVKNEIFSCPLLPLPQAVNGEVQLSRAALENVLPAELHKWMFCDTNQDPIVYIAFGTIVKGVRQIVDKLVKALDGGKWRVLWSLPADMHEWLPAGLSKEHWCIQSFVPQKDIFKCDRVKCFISHCGANSTIEAMACGVPMVCHPFFMDQYEWARTVRKHLRAGVQVDKFDSPAEAYRLAVSQVLEDPSYRTAAQAVSKRLLSQADQIQRALGPSMVPKENLGPGVSVIAGVILSLMKNKDPKEVIRLVQDV